MTNILAMVLALMAFAVSGAAAAGDADSARWEHESQLVYPPDLPPEDVDQPAIKGKSPKMWRPVQEPAKPPVRNEPVWAQDGYVFKYSF